MAHFPNSFEENYLKTIFKLSNKKSKLNNIALSKAMNLNPATVLEMVRKMAEKKLVQLLPDKTIQLTEKGKKEAVIIIRKHRLWEVFLVNKLEYKWNEIHALAEQLEHVQSEDMVDRLDKYLGYPAFDPHGDPIPDKKGKIKLNASIPLSMGHSGKTYMVKSFAETSDSFLDYLSKLNIKPGQKIKIINLNEFDNSSLIRINNKTIQLSEKAAQNILVDLYLHKL